MRERSVESLVYKNVYITVEWRERPKNKQLIGNLLWIQNAQCFVKQLSLLLFQVLEGVTVSVYLLYFILKIFIPFLWDSDKIQRGQRNSSLIERDCVYGAKASKGVHKREASLKVKYSPKRCISLMCLSWNLDSHKKSIMHQYGSPIHISQSGTWMSLSELRTGNISFSHSSLLALPPKRMISSDAWFIAW